MAHEDSGESPVDSKLRCRKGHIKSYSIHFSKVLQQNEITIEGDLRLRKNSHKDNDKTKLLGH